MSADWYYLKSGWLGNSRRVGPLTDADLVARIDKGEIRPETLIQSDTKTRGRWLKMHDIPTALERWKSTHPAKS